MYLYKNVLQPLLDKSCKIYCSHLLKIQDEAISTEATDRAMEQDMSILIPAMVWDRPFTWNDEGVDEIVGPLRNEGTVCTLSSDRRVLFS